MNSIARTTLLLTALLAIGLIATPASAVVATFTTTGDNAFGDLEPYKYNNEGAEYWLPIGDWGCDQRDYMRFDVRSLGHVQNLQVHSIVLKLFSAGVDSNTPQETSLDNVTPVHPEIHAISAANRDWVEGTGTGYDFVPNQACYVAKQTGASPGSVVLPWAGSPGMNTPGVDFDPKVLATRSLLRKDLQTVGAAIDFTFSGTSAELTGLIKSWLVDNYTLSRDNPGILIIDPSVSLGSHRRSNFFSLQCTNPPGPPWTGPGGPDVPTSIYPAGYQPQLIVTYSHAPEPGTLILLFTGGLVFFAYAWRKR